MNRMAFELRHLFGPSVRRPMSVRPGNAFRPTLHRMPLAKRESGPTDPLGRDAKLARIEAALLLADEPITTKRLAEAVGLSDGNEARRQIERLKQLYETDNSTFEIADVAGGVLLLSKPVYHPWLLRLRRTGHDVSLSPAALETLAIVEIGRAHV